MLPNIPRPSVLFQIIASKYYLEYIMYRISFSTQVVSLLLIQSNPRLFSSEKLSASNETVFHRTQIQSSLFILFLKQKNCVLIHKTICFLCKSIVLIKQGSVSIVNMVSSATVICFYYFSNLLRSNPVYWHIFFQPTYTLISHIGNLLPLQIKIVTS